MVMDMEACDLKEGLLWLLKSLLKLISPMTDSYGLVVAKTFMKHFVTFFCIA